MLSAAERKRIREVVQRLDTEGLGRPAVEYGNQTIYPMAQRALWPVTDDVEPVRLSLAALAPDRAVRVYVHVPFCPRRCHYCEYYSLGRSPQAVERYLAGLGREVDLVVDAAGGGRACRSLYLGGGTPTLLANEQLGRVLAAVRRSFALTAGAVFTVEGSPRTVNPENLQYLRAEGVNVLGLGIQSFDVRVLRAAGRDHDVAQAKRAVAEVLRAGFDILDVDLIYGLPEQTEESFRETVRVGCGLGIPEFSLYLLRSPPGSKVAKTGGYFEREVELFAAAAELFAGAGYVRVRPHHYVLQERLEVWRHLRSEASAEEGMAAAGGATLAFGPDACSHVGSLFYANPHDLEGWAMGVEAGRLPADRWYELSAADRAARYLIGKLGQKGELDLADFRRRYGELSAGQARALRVFAELGLVQREGEQVRTTETGKLFYDCLERGMYP